MPAQFDSAAALAFSAWVGVNLFHFGFSNACPTSWFLHKLSMPEKV